MATRRLFRADFKANVLLEVFSGRKRTSAVCREYHLKPTLDSISDEVVLFGCEQRIGIADGVVDELNQGRLALGDDIEADQRLDVMRQDWTQLHWKTPANRLTVCISRVAGVEDSYADKHRRNHPNTRA